MKHYFELLAGAFLFWLIIYGLSLAHANIGPVETFILLPIPQLLVLNREKLFSGLSKKLNNEAEDEGAMLTVGAHWLLKNGTPVSIHEVTDAGAIVDWFVDGIGHREFFPDEELTRADSDPA